ncbi:MAG: thioredoxin family protein [Alphaproteobacteria bacterium]
MAAGIIFAAPVSMEAKQKQEAGASIPHLTGNTFNYAIVSSAVPVLVQFDAKWCGYCKAMQPLLDKLRDSTADVIIYKVDMDSEPVICSEYGVSTLPTLIIFSRGQPVARNEGAMDKSELFDWVGDVAKEAKNSTVEN